MSKQQAIGKVATALSFFACTIKSGEDWSIQCETVLREAQQALVVLGEASPQGLNDVTF